MTDHAQEYPNTYSFCLPFKDSRIRSGMACSSKGLHCLQYVHNLSFDARLAQMLLRILNDNSVSIPAEMTLLEKLLETEHEYAYRHNLDVLSSVPSYARRRAKPTHPLTFEEESLVREFVRRLQSKIP